jgi:deoxyribodipyrimidine photo-lyase
MTTTALVWLRRDFRLADNPALALARENHDQIVPVYIHDPEAEGAWSAGAASCWWLHHSLASLDHQLRQRGSRLLIARGESGSELVRLASETGADSIYWNRLYDPALVARDTTLKKRLISCGLQAQSCKGAVLFEPWEVLKKDGSPYLVFTPYWKQLQINWHAPQRHPEPADLRGLPSWPPGLNLKDLHLLPSRNWADRFDQHWRPGEPGARQRLGEFVDQAVSPYAKLRDIPGRDGTSRLSAHLHFGEITPGQIACALDEAGELPVGEGRLSFLREIAWREFSIYLLFHYPHIAKRPLKDHFLDFPWREPGDYLSDLDAWKQGRTGLPVVDAGMRQLWQTGWMHNRVRMIVASFLTKNLLIPWQEGARWFWDTLVDADLANNTQGWQWTAGCGADAAPWFRIFNPVLQGQKFDPQGDYVRRWCPELARRPASRIHHPLRQGEAIGDYPGPIVDLMKSRQRALEAYAAIRGG